jgi:type III secretion control protein HpaP
MNTPFRWGGLKVHASKDDTPTPDNADRRRRLAFAGAGKHQPAVATRPVLLRASAKAASDGMPAAYVQPALVGRRRGEPEALPQAPEHPPADAAALPEAEPGPAASLDPGSWFVPAHGEPVNAQPLHAAAEVAETDEAQAGQALVAYIAGTVSAFCNNPAVRDADGWHIRIRLNDSILSSTTLHLKLTLHWLILRFECRDALARRLVLAQGPRLIEALEAMVSPRREVSMDVD